MISFNTMATAMTTAVRGAAEHKDENLAAPPVSLGASLAKATGTTKNDKRSSSAGDSSGASASLTVQTLQKQIERLQKQLAQQQQQLRQAMSGDRAKDPTNTARIAALQSAVNTTVGQLAEAVAKLAAAIMAESGGSNGGLVNTSA